MSESAHPEASDLLELPYPALFLADCHIPLVVRPGQETWRSRVIQFLREVGPSARSLVLLGDLFDFWFEWRRVVPGAAFPVLEAIAGLCRQGVQVLYIGGNHDGHIGQFLQNEVGIRISRQPVDALIGEKRFHLIHGDGLAPRDRGYRLLRRIVRWGPTEHLYRLIHPDLGIYLAYCLSGTSRSHFGEAGRTTAEDYRKYARTVIDRGFDFVVMGHRHEAEWLPHSSGGMLAIGDWIRKGSYGWFDGKRAILRFYNNDSNAASYNQ
ncbi:MAG: UDP-2,3-diacylglucosamine diphosphatase [Calditrichaeota bacterium]|nr:UDP-2,3-diacylglucosamine diphosphatase [Calditrichota bacterium]